LASDRIVPAGTSSFAQRFEAAYGSANLPDVYRQFIVSDAYLPYATSLLRGLWTYGPTHVQLNLCATILLDRRKLFDEAGIDPRDASQYHPIATLRSSPQFLAIDATVAAGPVFLWHHETGAFHLQFETFSEFVGHLQTPEQVREETARVRETFASIRKECKPALLRARKHYEKSRLDEALRELDRVLQDREPIPYTGQNDFAAIGILCGCFNLRGLVFLAHGRLGPARAEFLRAIRCGGVPYWEAFVNAVVTSFLLGDVQDVLAHSESRGTVRRLTRRAADPKYDPEPILKRNFSPAQLEELTRALRRDGGAEEQRAFARDVLAWME